MGSTGFGPWIPGSHRKTIIHFQQISYLKTGLKPNKRISITLSAKDTLDNNFQVTDEFKTDASGILNLDHVVFNSFFARAKNNSNNAFLLPEFDKYFINLKSTGNASHFTPHYKIMYMLNIHWLSLVRTIDWLHRCW